MLELRYKFIALDQYGELVWIEKHPRKELLAHCLRQHAEKMYLDTRDKKSHHVGYVIAGRWFNVMRVAAWEYRCRWPAGNRPQYLSRKWRVSGKPKGGEVYGNS